MDNTFDKLYYDRGELIAGVDESGVSDIAGPLVAACVILPKIDPRRDDLDIFEVQDSKTVPEKHRKRLAEIVYQTALGIGIGVVEPREMDYLKRQRSINLAMGRAVMNCKNNDERLVPDFILVDGRESIKHTQIAQKAIIKADEKSLAVASASIIAKVYRDSVMAELHTKYPEYGWLSNKGYPCDDHYRGLDERGIVFGVHRTSVWPFTPSSKKETKELAKRRRKWKTVTENLLHQQKGGFHGQ